MNETINRLLATLLVGRLTACSYDWTIVAADAGRSTTSDDAQAPPSTCIPGGTCSQSQTLECPRGMQCELECPTGGCKIDCGSGATCKVNCAGGGCETSCQSGSTCTVACAAGACKTSCSSGLLGLGSATCKNECDSAPSTCTCSGGSGCK